MNETRQKVQPTQEPKENIFDQNYYQNYYPQPLPEHINVQPVQATDEIIFDHNVIFLVDSNLKQMNNGQKFNSR